MFVAGPIGSDFVTMAITGDTAWQLLIGSAYYGIAGQAREGPRGKFNDHGALFISG